MSLLLGLLVWRKKNGRIAAALGTLCLMVLAFVVWSGTSALWHRFTQLQGWMRLAMTKDGLRMLWHKRVLGWGLGTFTTMYPQFRSFYTNLFVNAAHNDYVQVLVETGLIGFAAVAWFIVEVYRAGLANAEGWNRLVAGARTGCAHRLHRSAGAQLLGLQPANPSQCLGILLSVRSDN